MNNPILYIDPDGRGVWKPNGDGTWTAEAGDSAATLAEDAGISFERAKEIMANTPKDNPQGNMGTYVDPNDKVEKSAVDEGDVVAIPEQVKVFKENEAAVENLETEITTNEATIAENNKKTDSLEGVKKKAEDRFNIKDTTGVYRPAPGDPRTGRDISRMIDQTRLTRKKRKIDKKIGNLKNKSDSLNNENNKKRAEIIKRGYLPKPSNYKRIKG